jgi:hypothetical protein
MGSRNKPMLNASTFFTSCLATNSQTCMFIMELCGSSKTTSSLLKSIQIRGCPTLVNSRFSPGIPRVTLEVLVQQTGAKASSYPGKQMALLSRHTRKANRTRRRLYVFIAGNPLRRKFIFWLIFVGNFRPIVCVGDCRVEGQMEMFTVDG